MDTELHLDLAIDRSMLTPPVRRALNSARADIAAWEVMPVAHRLINRVSGRICRVRGTARDGASDRSFSLILKMIHLPVADATSFFNGSDDPAHWNYWKREALAYQSGMLDPIDSEACRLCAELAG